MGAHIAEAFSRCLTTSSHGTRVKSRSSETFFWYFLFRRRYHLHILRFIIPQRWTIVYIYIYTVRSSFLILYIYCTLYFQNFRRIIIFFQYTLKAFPNSNFHTYAIIRKFYANFKKYESNGAFFLIVSFIIS